MNLDNVVLIRAFNYLPLNGEIVPSCDGKYLIPDVTSEFSMIMREKIKKALERELKRELDPNDKVDRYGIEKYASEYYPLTSSYSSIISFSLNGLAPDNEQYTFSNMKVAVIDPIKSHLDADFVNINPIETTIKGKLKVSPDAILVIERKLFESLSSEEKSNLMSHYKLEVFNCSLSEAVNATLLKYNYPVLPLVNERKCDYILDCTEKKSMLEFQRNFAQSVNASLLTIDQLLSHLIFLNKIDYYAADKINKEYRKDIIIYEYYRNKLFGFLETKAAIYNLFLTEEEKRILYSGNEKTDPILRQFITKMIHSIGLTKFKILIQEFNQSITEDFLTNTEILALNGESRK